MPASLKEHKHVKSSWVSSANYTKKPWGSETAWSAMKSIHGKMLYIDKGHRTSYKFHQSKNEVLFLLKGKAKITHGHEYTLEDPVGWPLQTIIIESGKSLSVQSGCPYRIEALEDCEIIEIGDNRASVTIRIEDDYGRRDNKPDGSY